MNVKKLINLQGIFILFGKLNCCLQCISFYLSLFKLRSFSAIIILTLACVWRVGWLGTNSFGYDEAYLSLLALKITRFWQYDFPIIGLPSSGGIPNFPAAVWFFAIPYIFTSDPLVVTALLALLNAVSIVGLWWVGRTLMGEWVGFVIGFLGATSPYLILYSRNIWAQNLLPTLMIVWLIGWLKAVKFNQRWGGVLCGFCATFAFQIHFAGVALIPITSLALILAYFRRWVSSPLKLLINVTTGAIVGALLGLPALISVVCCQTGVREQIISVFGRSSIISTDALMTAIKQLSGIGWQNLLFGDLSTARLLTDTTSLVIFSILFLMGSWVWARQSHLWLFVLAVCIASTIFIFTRHVTPINPQYLILVLPVSLLIIAGSINLIQHPVWRGFILVILIAQNANQLIALSNDLSLAGRTAGGIGTPLTYPRNAINALRNGSPIVVYAEGDDATTQGDPAIFETLLWQYPHRIVNGRHTVVIPNIPSHAFLTYEAMPALPFLQNIGAINERFFVRRANEPLYVYEWLNPDNINDRFITPITPITIANIALTGYSWVKKETQWRFITRWQVDSAPNDVSFHLFHHLRDNSTQNKLLAQEDVPMSSRSWQRGDVVYVWADFKPNAQLDNANELIMQLGIYRYPSLQRLAPLAPASLSRGVTVLRNEMMVELKIR